MVIEKENRIQALGSRMFILNEEDVVDAAGLMQLKPAKAKAIQRVWITHAHFDHIADLPLFIEHYFDQRESTLTLLGLAETIDALKKHIFNGIIWPDFSKITLNNKKPVICYRVIDVDKEYRLSKHQKIIPFMTDHTVSSCGYLLLQREKGLMIATDTYSLKNINRVLERYNQVDALILECSFPNRMKNLAIESKHLTPKELFLGLEKRFSKRIVLYINHFKESYKKEILDEIEQNRGIWQVKTIKSENFITF